MVAKNTFCGKEFVFLVPADPLPQLFPSLFLEDLPQAIQERSFNQAWPNNTNNNIFLHNGSLDRQKHTVLITDIAL